jgi:quercetin dioxygenase-like cupin family protein
MSFNEHQKRHGKILPGVLALAAALAACGQALAGPHEQEPALTKTYSDPDLEWGPCPEFFGVGCHIAVLHGNPAEPNTDVFFRLRGGKPFPPHRHTSAERMVLVAGEMEVIYENEQPAVLVTGTYAYGPAERVHHGRCVSEQDCVLFIAFEQPVDAFEVASE